jgi:hypothetical protein
MAGSQSKEAKYIQDLKNLGVYDPAFDSVIHTLCVQERELSRAQKSWAATKGDAKYPSIDHPLYAEISKLRRDILARQGALGLTPKSWQRLRRQQSNSAEAAPISGTPNQGFAALMDRIKEASHAGK